MWNDRKRVDEVKFVKFFMTFTLMGLLSHFCIDDLQEMPINQ